MLRKLLATLGLLGSFAAFTAAAQAEIPPSDQLLPATTKAYISAVNMPKAIAAFEGTPIGRLLRDPKMKAFSDDLKRQLDKENGTVQSHLGMPLEDLEALPTGEVAYGLIELAEHQAGSIALLDVTDNLAKAQAALKKAEAQLVKGGAKKAERQAKAAQVSLTVFTIPPKGDRKKTVTAIYFLHDGLLGFSDSLEVVEDVLDRWVNQGKDSLSSVEDYQTVLKRADRSGLKPNIRWYVEPLAAMAASQKNIDKKAGGRDWTKILAQEFAAVKALGGIVSMATAPYGAVHSSYVLAPPPYQRSMKMLKFPNVEKYDVPAWVPAKLASFTEFEWDILNAFDNFDTFFDEVVGEGEEGTWKDVIDSLEKDPNGPQISLRNDLAANLDTRCVLMIDTELPIHTYSQRRLFAAQAKDEAKLAITVEKSMKGDQAVKVHEVIVDGKTYKIFEMIPEEEAIPELQVQVGGQEQAAPAMQAVPHPAVTVAHGWLFIATHVNLLEQIIKTPQAPEPLAADKDYLKVVGLYNGFHKAPRCTQIFTRDDERTFVAYELFRQGKLPQADLPIADVMNAIFDEEEVAEGDFRQQKLDGSKLPDFDVARKYFSTSGMFICSENGGWFLMGFSLDKDNAGPVAGGAAAGPGANGERNENPIEARRR